MRCNWSHRGGQGGETGSDRRTSSDGLHSSTSLVNVFLWDRAGAARYEYRHLATHEVGVWIGISALFSLPDRVSVYLVQFFRTPLILLAIVGCMRASVGDKINEASTCEDKPAGECARSD